MHAYKHINMSISIHSNKDTYGHTCIHTFIYTYSKYACSGALAGATSAPALLS